ESAKAALIFVACPATASVERREKALKKINTAVAEAKKLEPSIPHFGKVAIKFSDDAAKRYVGGDIGWLEKGNERYIWKNNVVDAIFALSEPAEISDIITTDDGYYIAKLSDRRPQAAHPLESIRNEIKYRAFQEKRKRLYDDFYTTMKAGLEITTNQLLLETIEPPSGKKSGAKDAPVGFSKK
ncbi:MAG: peptidylprolyl isomerase, partial [Nitrospirota bacterium]|nr:peptidylprolyl isomerase [Nitrospirota bacterium]